jgi:hypothetical protein
MPALVTTSWAALAAVVSSATCESTAANRQHGRRRGAADRLASRSTPRGSSTPLVRQPAASIRPHAGIVQGGRAARQSGRAARRLSEPDYCQGSEAATFSKAGRCPSNFSSCTQQAAHAAKQAASAFGAALSMTLGGEPRSGCRSSSGGSRSRDDASPEGSPEAGARADRETLTSSALQGLSFAQP